MSEAKFCVLCHDQVWFGAYGTTKQHIIFKAHPTNDVELIVCVECRNTANHLPIEMTEEEKGNV